MSKMDTEAVTAINDNRKTIDNAKITSGIPPNFDQKVVSDEELVGFVIEVDNVKKWYMYPEQRRQWLPGCATKKAKTAFHKRAFWYQFQEKTQKKTLYRIIKKKDQGKTE